MEAPVESENRVGSSPQYGRVLRNRPRLLHSFASSFVTIGHKAYKRAEDRLGGSPRKVVRGAAFVAGPFVRRAEQNWLSSVYWIDIVILFVEKMLSFIFPPIQPVFAKIDELVFFADALPQKFDEVLDDFPKVAEQLCSLLKRFASTIMNMNSSNSEERQVNVVDIDMDRQSEQGREQKKNLECVDGWKTDDDDDAKQKSSDQNYLGSEKDDNSSVDEDTKQVENGGDQNDLGPLETEGEKDGNSSNVTGQGQEGQSEGGGGGGGEDADGRGGTGSSDRQGGTRDNVGGEQTKLVKGGNGKGKVKGKGKGKIKGKGGAAATGPKEGSNKSEGVARTTTDPIVQMLEEGWQQKGI